MPFVAAATSSAHSCIHHTALILVVFTKCAVFMAREFLAIKTLSGVTIDMDFINS